jgi:hypothetical protein
VFVIVFTSDFSNKTFALKTAYAKNIENMSIETNPPNGVLYDLSPLTVRLNFKPYKSNILNILDGNVDSVLGRLE